MITVANLLETIKILGFIEQSAGIYQKSFGDLLGCLVTVDFNAKKITYPADLKINDETTCNFAHPENFVVLECVTRLLDKGYRRGCKNNANSISVLRQNAGILSSMIYKQRFF